MTTATPEVVDLRPLPEGRRLRVRRVAVGLSQEQLADLVNVPASRVSDAERGRPTGRAFVERLSGALAELERGGASAR